MTEIKQVYRNRAEAFREFVQAYDLPVKRAKFYGDCDDLGMVQTDKTVLLADLLGYARNELKIDPLSGQALESQAARERAEKMANLEMRKLEAEVTAKERANRKEDDRWIEVVEHETQMAAFAGRIEEALQQVTTLQLMELLYLCGGDPAKAPEFNAGLEDLYAAAMTDAVRAHTQTVAFEGAEAPDGAG